VHEHRFGSNIFRFAEALVMNVILLIFMVVFVFQNQVIANEEQKSATHVEAIFKGRSSNYSDFNFACVLVDDPSSFDRNKAFLAIDKSGRPAVYPLFEREHSCIMLSRHSLTDILAHWVPAKVEHDVYSFAFSYWKNGTWKPAQVDLRFRKNYCSQFRVLSDDIKVRSWLPAGAIPMEVDRPSNNGTLKLPLFIGLVEGPRDTSDCGIRPLSDRYWKALKEGKCPLGLRTSSDAGH
jgi:hypothetical protein